MSRPDYDPGPFFGRAERLTRERKAREYAKRERLRAELAKELATSIPAREANRIGVRVGVAKHTLHW